MTKSEYSPDPPPRAGWYDSAWKYRKKITIDHTKVSNSNQENFPVLISLKDPVLKTTTHGGHVSQSQGEDILFVLSDGITRLAYQLEKHDSETGELRVWIRIPILSYTTDTILYLYYGNSIYSSGQNPNEVWDSSYKMVLHLNQTTDTPHDSTVYKNNGVLQKAKSQGDYIKINHSNSFNMTDAITVEAWVDTQVSRAEALQALVSKWALLTTLNTFDAYDAGNTDNLNTQGFFGAVFDGRYVYFAPAYDGTGNHGKVLRYDTQGNFSDSRSWSAYDAGNTSSLSSKGYYGAVFDGRYVYFVPRLDKNFTPDIVHHSRILRYDTTGDFKNAERWRAYDAGNPISYQGAAFDGRYIYFCPGYEQLEGNYTTDITKQLKEVVLSGKVLRYDTQGDFADSGSYTTYDAGNTSGLNAKCYDGAVFDGRYIYFVPLESKGVVLRYDTRKDFAKPESWTAYDANHIAGVALGWCVGAIFDGRYVYFVPYDHSVVVRYDTYGDFSDDNQWKAYDAGNTSGLRMRGWDGAVFDGKYIYFIPFYDGKELSSGFHANVLRYDTHREFTDSESWSGYDADGASGLRAIGFNGGAFDGRYIYFSPWRDGVKLGGIPAAHGRVLRYDTTGSQASFSLRYTDCGHNGGLCGALPGPSFLVNTNRGILNVRANKNLEPGRHHIAGIYDGEKISLMIDGVRVGERSGTGTIQVNDMDVTVGQIQDGLGYFNGTILEVRISSKARSMDWIRTEHYNLNSPLGFFQVGGEESAG